MAATARKSKATAFDRVQKLGIKLPGVVVATYFGMPALKPHYVDYACVLARLSRIDDEALGDLLQSGWRFVTKKKAARRAKRTRM